jgi:hypothetical protein
MEWKKCGLTKVEVAHVDSVFIAPMRLWGATVKKINGQHVSLENKHVGAPPSDRIVGLTLLLVVMNEK